MNHLAGLTLSYDPLAHLTEIERAELASFRASYEATAPKDCHAQAAPTYKLTSPLPDSGWRPLDDLTLWRFLSAGGAKIKQTAALARLAEALQWRKANDIDSIREQPPAAALKGVPLNIQAQAGLDDSKPPNMVMYTRTGELTYSGHTNQLSADEWCLQVAYSLEGIAEAMRASAQETGQPVSKQLVVLDVANALRSPRMAFRYVRRLMKASNLDVHYPMMNAKLLFINCSVAFSGFSTRWSCASSTRESPPS